MVFSPLKQRSIDWLSVFICMVWGRDLVDHLYAVAIRLPIISSFADFIIPTLYIIVIMMAWKNFSKFIMPSDVLFVLFFTFLYLLTYAIFPQNAVYLDDNAKRFLLLSLPLVFVGRAMDINKLFKPCYIISLIYIIIRFLVIIFFDRASRDLEGANYDMLAAYQLLPHLLMVMFSLLKKINIVDIVVSALGIFLIFSLGTRGPLFCLIVFVTMYFLLCKVTRKRFWTYLLYISLAGIAITFLSRFFDFIETYVEMFNMSNRIIESYNNDFITDDNGRTDYHNIIFRALSNSGVCGLGICGDRVATSGSYSHHLFIEIIASFGYYFGTIIILLLIAYIFKAFKCCLTQIEKGFLIVLISYAAHHFYSGTVLYSPLFFLMIGYCAKLIHNKQLIKNTTYERNENCSFVNLS